MNGVADVLYYSTTFACNRSAGREQRSTISSGDGKNVGSWLEAWRKLEEKQANVGDVRKRIIRMEEPASHRDRRNEVDGKTRDLCL